MTPAVRALIALLSFVVLWAGWLFWFLAYRSAARRAREAEEILTSLAVKIAAGDVAGCVPIGQAILKRAGLHVARKKGPPPEAS